MPTDVAAETPTATPTVAASETPAPSATPSDMVCNAAPGSFTLLAPATQDMVARRRVILKWNAAECADSYRVIVKARGRGAVVFEVSALTETEYRTERLERGKRYVWQVTAVNAFGETASDEWWFRIDPDGQE